MQTIAKTRSRRKSGPKFDHDRIFRRVAIDDIYPAPENESIYKPITPTDPDLLALADSIKERGIREPLVISQDRFILSGHRRHAAAKIAGLSRVPCRIEPISHQDPGFLPLLREYNRQRVKTLAEVTREEVVSADPEESHRALVDYRRKNSRVDTSQSIEIVGTKDRARITCAKYPFLKAIQAIIDELRDLWPLTVRQIHYVLLNKPPLIHASKFESLYQNDVRSYRAAIDLIGRGRLGGYIPWAAVDDETRPVQIWDVHASTAPFIRNQLDNFLKNYYRDLLQSQPNQIEIVSEKNTVANIVKPVAADYCVPMTTGRGYSSLPPRYKMAERFRESGKDKLIIIVVSDFDPEGEDIPHSFARSMRDDFDIKDIVAIKAALTREQIIELRPHPNNLEKKKGGARYKRFVEKHGNNGYELESIPPDVLQQAVRETIHKVLDSRAFNAEVDAEKQDAAHLDGVRRAVQQQLMSIVTEEKGGQP